MDKYIGRLLDNRYEILEIIGTGGMAVVYKARCHRLNRLVAIKILKDDYLQDEEFRRRFHSESQAVAMLSHPNIVSVYDVSSSIMADYIVMELIDGITLKQYMEKKGTLNWKETLHFGIQIAKALEHAHSRGIVHRDIKPHNVMVLKNGSVKVMDFGIARMMSKGNTLTKEALGSVHYISPEQAKGGRVDSRSDIYSLGVVMYEMMAGRPPYDGDSPVSVAIQHINGGAVMPSTLNPNIPGGLEQIIMKAMAHEIGDRYVSTTRMLSDMDEFRKNPSLLFDYNTPPIDAVTKMPTPLVIHSVTNQNPNIGGAADELLIEQEPRPKPQPRSGGATAAERAARKSDPRPRPAANSSEARRQAREREARRRQQQAAESSSRAATIAIIVCSIVAVLAIAIVIVIVTGGGVTRNEELVLVPDLIGSEYVEGMTVDGLTIRVEYDYNEEIPKDQIYGQNPLGGKNVAKGGKLILKVSMGPPEEKNAVLMDYAQMRKDQAIDHLTSLSMDLEIVSGPEYEEYNADVGEGKVIRTDPPAGSTLTVGQKVVVYVSKGPGDADMPDLKDKTLEASKKLLENLELDLVIVEEKIFDSEVKEGYVIKTEPAAGSQVKVGQQVKIYVSKGPEMKVMPNVVNMTPLEAVRELTNAGFKNWSYDGDTTATGVVVLEQSHEAGKEVDINAPIVLTIGLKKVTKDVDINLRGAAGAEVCVVTVTCNGTTVFEKEVQVGTEKITLKGQTGSGTVVYLVSINGGDPWEESVNFS